MCVPRAAGPCVQAESARLCELLSRVRIESRDTYGRLRHRFLVRGPPTNLPANLPANLAVLRAIQFVDHSDRAKNVRLTIEGLDSSVMSALQDLPPMWGGDLALRFTQWSLQPYEARALGAHIPASYSRLQLLGCTDQTVVHGVCDGLNERREGLGFDPVVVLYDGVGPDDGLEFGQLFYKKGLVPRGMHVLLFKMQPGSGGP